MHCTAYAEAPISGGRLGSDLQESWLTELRRFP